MKALILSEYKKLDLVDMQKPQPDDDELLIRVQACGVCGSDVHGYDGSTGRRLPPIVMGHEAAGIVEAVGSAVENFHPGDHVTFDSTVFCGRCFYCRRGMANLCDDREVIGVSTRSLDPHFLLRVPSLCDPGVRGRSSYPDSLWNMGERRWWKSA